MVDFDLGPDGRSTDLAPGHGVPDWLAEQLNFCSNCGASLRFGSIPGEMRHRLSCPSCGHIAYVNPRLVVTTLPITDAGEIILLRRGIEPGFGSWAQPGGFLEVDETVNQAAIRETWEETGLLVEPGEIVGLYTRLEAAVVTLVYEARIVGGTPGPTPEALEVRPAERKPVVERPHRRLERDRRPRDRLGRVCTDLGRLGRRDRLAADDP